MGALKQHLSTYLNPPADKTGAWLLYNRVLKQHISTRINPSAHCCIPLYPICTLLYTFIPLALSAGKGFTNAFQSSFRQFQQIPPILLQNNQKPDAPSKPLVSLKHV